MTPLRTLVLALALAVPATSMASAPYVQVGEDLWVTLSDSGRPEAVRALNVPAWSTALPVRCGEQKIRAFHRVIARGAKIVAEADDVTLELDPATGAPLCATLARRKNVVTKDSFAAVALGDVVVASDGHRVSGAGWSVEASKLCGSVGPVRRMRAGAKRVELTVGKHCAAEIDGRGKFSCKGCD